MASKTFLAKDLTGFSVYQNKNQTIYYDRFTKTPYIINNSSVMSFTNYQLRLPVSLLIGLGISLITANPILSLLLTIVVYAIFEYNFRTKLLANLAINTKWGKPVTKGFINKIARAYSTSSLKTMAFLCYMFVGIFVATAFVAKEQGTALIIDAVFTSILFIIATVLLIAFKKRQKEEK